VVAPDRVPDSVPDPFDDAEALGELEHEIATLAAHIAAATYRLLTLIAEFDRRRGWELGGHRSCAHWLHATTGIDLGAAREKVRTARVLVGLPRTSERMARGELSFSAVRALTRVATPECEEELLEVARTSTTAQLERFVRVWRKLSRADEAKLERERWRSRRLSVFPDDEGMSVVRGRLPAETGALLMRAVEATGDALFRGEARTKASTAARKATRGEEEVTPKQRRADAMGLVAERAMAIGFGATPKRSEDVSAETREGEGAREGQCEPECQSGGSESSAPISGPRAERYQVMLHVDAETLQSREGDGAAQDGEGVNATTASLDRGRSHLEDGTRVSAETSRRLSCDASLVEVLRRTRRNGGNRPNGSNGPNGADGANRAGSRSDGGGPGGEYRDVLDVGRRTRTIPPALRRALEVRDRGCRFPGCGLRFTDGHHVKHWADGGETKLDNLILLCRLHHRLVHEGGWRVEFWGKAKRAAFIDPRGGIRMDVERKSEEERHRGADRGGGRVTEQVADRVADRVTEQEVVVPDRPVEALMGENRARSVDPDGWKLGPELPSPGPDAEAAVVGWRPSDARWAIHARALEALDEAHFGG